MAGKVTALEIQKKNKERVNVYIDHEFAFGLTQLAAAALRKGDELSDEKIAALKDQDDVAKAMDSAVRFLAHRPRSAAEVRRRLNQKGVSEYTIESVIARLSDLNYINDLEFAQYWVRNREEFNPRGTRALEYELRQKGIDNATIAEALTDLDPEQSAYAAAQKKVRSLRGKDAATIRKKLGGFLARRGFQYDVVRQVVNQIIDELEAEGDDEHYI